VFEHSCHDLTNRAADDLAPLRLLVSVETTDTVVVPPELVMVETSVVPP
jgi:hypothetical protein